MTPSPNRANDALTNFDDEHLAVELSRGRHEALSVLFERHSRTVFRMSKRILGDDGEAEETVQEVFMQAYKRISQFDATKASFRTWLLTNARCRAIDRKRSLQSNGVYRWVAMVDSAIPDGHSSKQLPRFSRHELTHFVEQLLEVLSPSERRVIHLHLYRDLTLEETQKELQAPLSAIRHLYYGAMKKLRAAFLAKAHNSRGKASLARKAGHNASS
jgi:RNA polymerase sigma-70 factor (ECF subfamily)